MRDAPFGPLEDTSLKERVAQEIRTGIVSGVLMPGQRLIEAEIAAAMGISRSPVREGLERLEAEGLVTRRPRRGVVVTAPSRSALDEIYELRLLLEPVMVRATAEHATEAELEELRDIVGRMREAAERNDWSEIVHRDRRFHAAVGRMSGRTYMAQMFDLLNEQMRLFMGLLRPEYPDPRAMADEHEELLEAIASRDPGRAAQLMEGHLEDARRRLLARMDSGGEATSVSETTKGGDAKRTLRRRSSTYETR